MKRLERILPLLLCLAALLPPVSVHAQGQMGDYGDAPEGGIAYPDLGVIGQFPTCILVGPAGSYVFHLPQPTSGGAWFGPGFDFEPDGNAGVCGFPPYDQDECQNDGDAGLIVPGAFTILGGAYATCPNSPGGALGNACGMAVWGPNIDIQITNTMNTTVFLNVLFDWNRDGKWGGKSLCTGGPGGPATVPEWCVKNFPVPAGFSGPASALGVPPFMIGPLPGAVWSRFNLSEVAINNATGDWDGSGTFDRGETEDYLIRVAGQPPIGDYGDAPEGGLAYPDLGVLGQFPTCVGVGPASFVFHAPNSPARLGPSIDYETDGNGGTCTYPPYNNDECGFLNGDAGLFRPDAYTISTSGGYIPCPNHDGAPLGWTCLLSTWGGNLDVRIFNGSTVEYYMNILVDWNRDGRWSGISRCPTTGIGTPEHLLQNVIVPAGYAGNLSGLVSGTFMVPSDPGFVWTRVTLSDQPVPVDWDGSGFFAGGETEDYLLRIDPMQSGADETGLTPPALALEAARPNPFAARTAITFALPTESRITVTVHDLAGRIVKTLVDESRPAGRYTLEWDGTNDRGEALTSGIYFVKARSTDGVRTQKIVMAR